MKKYLIQITNITLVLALLVVTLGAYTRLTDAGLGCPDWPGCYGHMVLPMAHQQLQQAQHNYPDMPIETGKAWTEMAHRYLAGSLGLLIFIIFSLSMWNRKKQKSLPIVMPILLMLLVFFQAALGMWTVTLKLLPIVVMGHLLGGLSIFAGLSYFRWQLSGVLADGSRMRQIFVGCGVLVVFLQIALGGWVSSNYAGVACIGFPKCNQDWIPTLYLSQAFQLFSPIGQNYQGGLLDNDLRTTIQVVHRLGALVTLCYLLGLAVYLLWCSHYHKLRYMTWIAVGLLSLQIGLGIANVVYLLPLAIAVAHHVVAVLLLSTMVGMLYLVRTNSK